MLIIKFVLDFHYCRSPKGSVIHEIWKRELDKHFSMCGLSRSDFIEDRSMFDGKSEEEIEEEIQAGNEWVTCKNCIRVLKNLYPDYGKPCGEETTHDSLCLD